MQSAGLVGRLLRIRPWTLFVAMVLIPTLLVVCVFVLAFFDQSWLRLVAFFGFPAAIFQGVLFLSWEWAVATQLVLVSGERPWIRIQFFKLTFVCALAAMAFLLTTVFLWPTFPDEAVFLTSVGGTACVLYGFCFVASVVMRADLGSGARRWQVVAAAVGLWASSPVAACVLQRRVNRVLLRMAQPS